MSAPGLCTTLVVHPCCAARVLAYNAPISGTPLDLAAVAIRLTFAAGALPAVRSVSATAAAGSANATNTNTISIAFRFTI